MKTSSSLASRLLWTCAVTAILATASITGAQSLDEADAGGAGGSAGGGGAEGAEGAEGATPASTKTLDQVRQLGSEIWSEELTILKSTPLNPRQMAMKKVTELRAKLKSGEDRSAVEPQLRHALSEYFLADMRHRVRELDEIKAKVAETEAKLQRRLDSQQESINLQLKLFLQEADGLGFFPSEVSLDPTTSARMFYPSHPPELTPQGTQGLPGLPGSDRR